MLHINHTAMIIVNLFIVRNVPLKVILKLFLLWWGYLGGGGGGGFVTYYIPERGCVLYFFPDRTFYSGQPILHFVMVTYDFIYLINLIGPK